MLSIESPSTDPACSQQKPCNERASHKRGLPVADLSKPPIVNETSFPKFSIREYVLSSRSKDIKANWPFSSKTLQICLKHDVKDLLPPFQPLRSVKAPSIGVCTIENAKPESRSISSVAQWDHRGVLNSSKFAKSNEKRRQTCTESNSCRFEGGNDLQSTTTSLSPCEINLIPTICSSNSPLEFNSISESPAKTDAAEPPVSRKTEGMPKPLGKKCRFSVKYGAQAYQASGEDIVSNCTTTSEAMASKTCPVCRTFSSPSNTTLNAHIDQCLSAESTPKWPLDSISIKHKFKPRKTKLLVDIYTTALPCTLEDLDRRNGTTWAIASRPTPDIEKSDMHCEGNVDSGSLAPPKINNEDGVYFDAKGTKLRILSAFNDESLSKVKDNLRSTRPKKEDEGKKFKLSKRKIYHASKHKTFRKLAVQRNQISPQKDPTSQIDKGHDGCKGLEEGCKMEKHQMKSRKPHDSGCLRQWICSKRTGFAKKVISKEDHPKFRRKWLVSEDLLVQSDRSRLDDMKNEKNSAQRLTNMSENPIFSPENINMSEMECPLYGYRVLNNGGLIRDVNALPPMKENVYELKKGRPSMGDGFLMKPPNLNGDSCDILSKDCQATVLEYTKFSESSEKMSSFRESLSKRGSKSPLVKKRSALTNSQTDCRPKIDKKIMSLHSEKDQRCRLLDGSSESCSEREEIAAVLKSSVKVNENGRRLLHISRRNEAVGLTSLSSGSPTSKLCDDDNLHASVHGGLKCFVGKTGIEFAGEGVQIHKESTAIKSSSKAMSLANSVNPNVHELFDSSMARSGLLKFSISRKQPAYGAEEQDLETKLEFDYRQESTGVIRYNAHETGEFHSETSPANSFDPILIPGPPGSFLPSPGTMQSDEFQGNSSLTSSQVLSDEQDFTDGDSSDSPISSSSTFSTFTAARFDLDYFAPAQPNAFETKPRSVLSSRDLEPQTENTTTRTKNISCDRENLEKNLCCCQREQKNPPGVNLNYQQPQLLKHLSFPAVANPCCNKQKGYNLNRRLDDFEIPPSCCCNRVENATACARIGQFPEDVFRSISTPKELGVKLPDCGNFESATSSSSNPVLRLMGKNLMVTNKNEDGASRAEQTKPSSLINPVSEFPTNLNTSSGNSANKDTHFFHQRVHDDKNSWNYPGRHFDWMGFRTHVDLKTSQTFLPRPEVMHPSNQTDNGVFITSIEPSRHHQMNANSRAYPVEEIHSIVDGRPNCVRNMAAYGPKYSRDFGASRRLTPGI